jgi:hypothetical protein
MKKLSCIFIFLFAAGFQTLSAQVPGYQGKRFSVGYNASSFFYFTNFYDGISGVIESTKISYKTELSVHYTLSRKVSAGFSYYFAKQEDTFTKNEIQNFGYMTPKLGIAECKIAMYELHLQFFRKNFIAPAGLYHQISVGIVKYELATSDNKLKVYSNDNYYSLTLDGPKEPYSCFKLGYAIGKTNPIGHNFFINSAFGINFFRGGDSPNIRTTPTQQTYILANFNKNMRYHNFFEIKIGLGWLAF